MSKDYLIKSIIREVINKSDFTPKEMGFELSTKTIEELNEIINSNKKPKKLEKTL